MNTLKILFSNLFLLSGIMSCAQNPDTTLPVWPNGAPRSNGITEKSEIVNNHTKTNITEAMLYIYAAKEEKKKNKTILICPGGGYAVEAIFHEGHDFAKWLASEGITGVVLEYRLPNQHPEIPLTDVKEAMRILRSNMPANEKIGIAGFSAGGHLASTAITHYTDPETNPDFAVLFYPVITMDMSFTHSGSRENLLGKNPSEELINRYSNEKQVTANTPPTLLLLSDDDTGVVPKNSIEFYAALKEKNIPASMYIFPVGGHGWGMNASFVYHEIWKQLLLKWIEN